MFQKILLAVDGSESAGRATHLAADVARFAHGEVVVCHVTEAEPELTRGGLDPGEPPEAGLALVAGVSEKLSAEGISVKSAIRVASHGHVAAQILEVASAEAADVIVMGTRGLSDLSGAILGSVTHKVLHQTDRPVLITR